MRTLEVRPWKVRPGDKLTVEVFPFESPDGSGRATFTVRMVAKDRHFMTGESLWTLYAVEDTRGPDGRLGTYFRDERVRVTR